MFGDHFFYFASRQHIPTSNFFQLCDNLRQRKSETFGYGIGHIQNAGGRSVAFQGHGYVANAELRDEPIEVNGGHLSGQRCEEPRIKLAISVVLLWHSGPKP